MTPQQWQRGLVSAVDCDQGTVTATLQSGPAVTVPFTGAMPELYTYAWFVEVAPGALMCVGTPGDGFQCGIKIYLSANASLTNNAPNTIDWDNYEWFKNWWDTNLDPTGQTPLIAPGNALGSLTFPLTGNPNGLQVPFSGLYLVSANGTLNGSAVGVRTVQIRRNGTAMAQNTAGGNATFCSAGVSGVVKYAKGDTLDVTFYQNSGGALTLSAGVNTTYFSAVLLSAGTLDKNAEFMTAGFGYR